MVLMEKTILSSEILENFIYIKNGCLGTSVDVSLFLIDLCECSDRLFFLGKTSEQSHAEQAEVVAAALF